MSSLPLTVLIADFQEAAETMERVPSSWAATARIVAFQAIAPSSLHDEAGQ